jgi:integrase
LILISSASEYDVDVGIAAEVGHHIYARGGEVDALRVSDIVFGDDPRNMASNTLVFFAKPKAGRPQTAKVDSDFIKFLLKVQVARVRARGGGAHAPLFDFGPDGFLSRYKKVQVQAGYAKPIFVRHSLRHGGATEDYVTDARHVADISVRLRHAKVATTLIYLQDAQAHLLAHGAPAQVTAAIATLGGLQGLQRRIRRRLAAWSRL